MRWQSSNNSTFEFLSFVSYVDSVAGKRPEGSEMWNHQRSLGVMLVDFLSIFLDAPQTKNLAYFNNGENRPAFRFLPDGPDPKLPFSLMAKKKMTTPISLGAVSRRL